MPRLLSAPIPMRLAPPLLRSEVARLLSDIDPTPALSLEWLFDWIAGKEVAE